MTWFYSQVTYTFYFYKEDLLTTHQRFVLISPVYNTKSIVNCFGRSLRLYFCDLAHTNMVFRRCLSVLWVFWS